MGISTYVPEPQSQEPTRPPIRVILIKPHASAHINNSGTPGEGQGFSPASHVTGYTIIPRIFYLPFHFARLLTQCFSTPDRLLSLLCSLNISHSPIPRTCYDIGIGDRRTSMAGRPDYVPLRPHCPGYSLPLFPFTHISLPCDFVLLLRPCFINHPLERSPIAKYRHLT